MRNDPLCSKKESFWKNRIKKRSGYLLQTLFQTIGLCKDGKLERRVFRYSSESYGRLLKGEKKNARHGEDLLLQRGIFLPMNWIGV